MERKQLIKSILREGLNLPIKKTQSYLSGIASTLINPEWDQLYELAQQNKNKIAIKKILQELLKDKQVMVRIADNYDWSNGSNGFINFNSLNHYITDIGYKSFADNPDLFNDIEMLKKHILYNYASAEGNLSRGENYRNEKYDPTDDFNW